MKTFRQIPRNESGFLTAEFLFAFTMVIGCGIIIFALTFSLTTIEIAQYIVWSSARAFSVGNSNATGPNDSNELAAENKYKALTAAFPLLTGNGADSAWFRMPSSNDKGLFIIGDLTNSMRDGGIEKDNALESGQEARHPWVGVASSIDLVLFKGLQIPFLGKITNSPDDFNFPIRGILFRHPSNQECLNFFKQKFTKGVKAIRSENQNQETKWGGTFPSQNPNQELMHPVDDNGC